MGTSIKNRYVYGPSGEVGYIVKTPGYGKIVESKINERTQRAVEDAKNQGERDRMRHEEYMKDFWVSSDKHCLNSKIERFVEMGMKNYEMDLQHKKNKLKVMMLDEQSNLTHEYIDKAQKSANMLFETKVKRAEEIQSKAADAQKSFVQKAYERIFQENCDEHRTKASQENRKALNEMHQKQMCERLLAERLAQEEDKIWITLEYKEDERRLQRSNNEASEFNQHAKEYCASLDQQIKDIEFKRNNEECVDRIEESRRQSYQKLKDEELELRKSEADRQREIHSKALVEQIEANRLLRERRKTEETYLDKIMIEEDRKAAEKEQSEFVDNRAQMRCEFSIFKESLHQYNESLAAHEKDMELISEEFKKQHELKQLSVKQKSAQARRDLLNSCLEVRKQQIADRERVRQNMKDISKNEAEYAEFRKVQCDALDVTRKQKDVQNCKEASKLAQESEKYKNVLREREHWEDEQFIHDRNKKYEEIDMKTKEILSRPVQTTGTGQHPFLGPLLAAGELPSGGKLI